jgi:hypothetical protein
MKEVKTVTNLVIMKTANKYYLAQVDAIGGLRTEVPICLNQRCRFNKDYVVESQDSSYFRINIKKPKLHTCGGDIRFWSKNKKDVENFILGVKAANTVINELTKGKLNV